MSASVLGICLIIPPAPLHQVALAQQRWRLRRSQWRHAPVQVGQQDVPTTADTSNGDVLIAKTAPAPDVTDAVEPGVVVFDESPPAQQHAESPPDKVIDYLWSVYQRSPLKRDGHGEFTWKDISAAERFGLSLRDYVIGGIDPNFREQLYYAGLAMDAAGVEWTILSGFRDDYRQTIASGFKARPGNSLHGGSIATGGYAHGCAVDVASVDRAANQVVWRWLDLHGSEFGLHRPLAQIDPPHVQPQGLWHELAARLRGEDGRAAVGAGRGLIKGGGFGGRLRPDELQRKPRPIAPSRGWVSPRMIRWTAAKASESKRRLNGDGPCRCLNPVGT